MTVTKRVLVLLCCGASVATLLLATVTIGEIRPRDLARDLKLLAYSRLSSLNKTNATGQARQEQSEERRVKNVSQNITEGKVRKSPRKYSKPPPDTPILSGPDQSGQTGSGRQAEQAQQEKRTVSQNITERKEMVKDLRKPFIVPRESSEPTPNTPTPSAVTVSERQADTVPEALNDTHHNTSVTSLDLPSNVSDLYKRLVVVTAYSSNHFEEGKGIIASVQKYMPQTKILLYDLGLTAKERSNASKYCNVEVRTFQWDKYPEHVRQLSRYAWKPLIVREVSQEYDVIMYGDASVRVISPLIGKALISLLEFPFIDGGPYTMPMISLTDNRTIDYFNFPPSRQYMAKWGTVQAGCWLMLANDIMKQKVIEPWADCALHLECISPAGTSSGRCRMEDLEYKDGRYIGCHRFDQSALNIILAKEFGVQRALVTL